MHKQTASPGVAAVHAVDAMRKRGTWVLRAADVRTRGARGVELFVELAPDSSASEQQKKGGGAEGVSGLVGETRREDSEALLELRQKLLMAEIPTELDAALGGAQAMVDAFSSQLQVLNESRAALSALRERPRCARLGGGFRLESGRAPTFAPSLRKGRAFRHTVAG